MKTQTEIQLLSRHLQDTVNDCLKTVKLRQKLPFYSMATYLLDPMFNGAWSSGQHRNFPLQHGQISDVSTPSGGNGKPPPPKCQISRRASVKEVGLPEIKNVFSVTSLVAFLLSWKYYQTTYKVYGIKVTCPFGYLLVFQPLNI